MAQRCIFPFFFFCSSPLCCSSSLLVCCFIAPLWLVLGLFINPLHLPPSALFIYLFSDHFVRPRRWPSFLREALSFPPSPPPLASPPRPLPLPLPLCPLAVIGLEAALRPSQLQSTIGRGRTRLATLVRAAHARLFPLFECSTLIGSVRSL